MAAKSSGSKPGTATGGLSGGGTKGPKRAASQSQTVKELLKNAATKLKKKEAKPSLGDYIRLLQLQKELEAEEPREIQVSWVEPAETEPESGDGG